MRKKDERLLALVSALFGIGMGLMFGYGMIYCMTI